MAEISKLLGANIRRYRYKLGMTQKESAEKVQVSQETIGAIEKGRKWLTLRTLTKISNSLQVDQVQLFEDPQGGGWKVFTDLFSKVLSNVPPDVLESLSETTDFSNVRESLKLRIRGSRDDGFKFLVFHLS